MSSTEAKTTGAVTDSSTTTPSADINVVENKDVVDHDIESLKPGIMTEVKLGDGGARRAELMQAAWGKHGKFWIFFGLGLCMLS